MVLLPADLALENVKESQIGTCRCVFGRRRVRLKPMRLRPAIPYKLTKGQIYCSFND